MFRMKLRRKTRILIVGAFAFSYLFLTGYFMIQAELEKTILAVRSSNLTRSSIIAEQDRGKCVDERRNFVFIKCMKCATESLGTIFRRFGYMRHLKFALPTKRNLYLGWPFPFEKKYVRPSKFEYNILFEHSIYNGPAMESLMPNDTVYITMIRSPWEQFKSSFNYFSLGKLSGVVPEDDIEEYLTNIDKYEAVYKSAENNEKRWCFPDGFSLTENIMSHCLGMPLGFPEGREDIRNNSVAVRSIIKDLNNRFLLIMIADYFYESLVLLKRLMCWNLKDILFHHANIRMYDYKSVPAEGKYFEVHKNWSRIDYMLFEYFNETFWQKIASEGEDFCQEVDHFRLVHLTVDRFCFVENSWLFPTKYVTIPSSRFSSSFNVTGHDCNLMYTYILNLLWERYYEDEGLQPEQFVELKDRPKPPVGCSI